MRGDYVRVRAGASDRERARSVARRAGARYYGRSSRGGRLTRNHIGESPVGEFAITSRLNGPPGGPEVHECYLRTSFYLPANPDLSVTRSTVIES